MQQDILSSLIWYFTKANTSLRIILETKPPLSDGDLMRFHYGVYIESILSACDYMEDKKLISETDIYEYINKDDFKYFRDLRNSIVHRGLNICSSASSNDSFIYYHTPQNITNQSKNIKRTPPSEKFLLDFLLRVDQSIRSLIQEKLNESKVFDFKEVGIDEIFSEISNFVEPHEPMPKVIKKLFVDNSDAIKASINMKEIHDSSVKKFRETMSLDFFLATER